MELLNSLKINYRWSETDQVRPVLIIAVGNFVKYGAQYNIPWARWLSGRAHSRSGRFILTARSLPQAASRIYYLLFPHCIKCSKSCEIFRERRSLLRCRSSDVVTRHWRRKLRLYDTGRDKLRLLNYLTMHASTPSSPDTPSDLLKDVGSTDYAENDRINSEVAKYIKYA